MRIGIDLGGTKIEAVALSPAGQEITRLRVATPRDYAASLDAIAGLVRELEGAAGGQGTVGVGREQVPERVDRPYDREEGPTQSLGHRGLGPLLERRLRGSARAEHDVPAPEDGLHVREPRRLERFLQVGHLRVNRHDTSEKRGIAWHELKASARQGTSSSPRHAARAWRACPPSVSPS